MSGGEGARATFSIMTLPRTLCVIPSVEFWTYYLHSVEVNSLNRARYGKLRPRGPLGCVLAFGTDSRGK